MRHFIRATGPVAMVAMAALAGCAASPAPATGSAPAAGIQASADEQVCTKEVKVGSILPVTVCRRPQTAAERDEVTRTMEQMQKPGAAAHVGPGG